MGRKRSNAYSPETTLAPIAFDKELEPLARRLFELSCCGSKELWPAMNAGAQLADPSFADKFYELANAGMFEAQQIIISKFVSEASPSPSAEALYRGVCDSIAWQFLGAQLCHARLLYKEHRQPTLAESNFSSVIDVVKDLRQKSPNCMPLLCDLTTFVQVGDIFLQTPRKPFQLLEVKEGREGRRISEMAQFYRASECERFKQIVTENETKHTVKQFQRNLRQIDRLGHVTEIMNKGDSVDPDTGERRVIPEPFIEIDTWEDDLNDAIEQAKTKGWALTVIEDCLFVGCYVEKHFLHAGHMLFNLWLDRFGGDANSPRAKLVDSMRFPLALPLFNRPLTPDAIFDLMFGRMQVCMGISIPKLIEQCTKSGISWRSATGKEQAELQKRGRGFVQYNGKPVFVRLGEHEMALMDGIFMRAMFHGQKPVSLIKALLENPIVVT